MSTRSSASPPHSISVPARSRRRSARIYWPLALVLVFLAGFCAFFHQANADDPPDTGSVSVSGSGPGSMYTNVSATGSFDASISGAPVVNQECTLKNVLYSWSASSEPAGVSASFNPNNSDKSNTVGTFSFASAGTYTVTVTANVSYETSCSTERQSMKSGSTSFSVTVVDQKVWDTGDGITGTASGAQTIKEGAQTTVSVIGAGDTDHWKKGTDESTEDDELNYSWSGEGTFSDPTSDSTGWTAPMLERNAGPSNVFRLTCTIDDRPRDIASNEAGSRDDAAKTVHVDVTVTQKYWDKDTGIQLGGAISGGGNGPVTYLEQGQSVTFNMPTATDSDHWVDGDDGDYEDDDLTYTWSGPGFDSADGQSVTWTAPPIAPNVGLEGPFAITCTVDDVPKAIGENDGGTRNDDPITKTVYVAVVRKIWSPTPGITGGDVSAPAANTRVSPSESVGCSVDEAHDIDTWTETGIGNGQAEDTTLTYTWTASAGGFSGTGADGGVGATATGRNATWVAPATGGLVILTCTIDDADSPRVDAPLEGGTKNDGALTRTVVVEVAPSVWSPTESAIGHHPKLGSDGQVIKNIHDVDGRNVTTYTWEEDGRLIAPIDQRVANAPSETEVSPGDQVGCAVETAQDWDTLTTAHSKDSFADGPLTYTWTASAGHFQVTHDDGTVTQETSVTGTSATNATWVAPEDITQDITVSVKCTIDDPDGARVTAPETGTHDDDGALVRTVQIKVIAPGGSAALSFLKAGSKPAPDAQHPPENYPDQFVGAGQTIGGDVYATLTLTLGKKTRVSSATATMRVTELADTANGITHNPIPAPGDDPAHPTQPLVGQDHVDLPVDFTTTTGWYRLYDPDGPNGPQVTDWWPAPQAPSAADTNNGSAQYRYLAPLKTTQPTNSTITLDGQFHSSTLLGHNGDHELSLSSVNTLSNGKLMFGKTLDVTPQKKAATVANLVITDVSTNNGTSDYFKFDPGSADGSDLKNPVIHFTIKDDGDPHVYRVRVRVRPTDVDDKLLNESVVYEKIVTSPRAVTINVNADPVGAEGDINAKITRWGTYNMQIRVLEYRTQQEAQEDIEDGRGHGGLGVISRNIDQSYDRSEFLSIPYQVAPWPNPDIIVSGHGGDLRYWKPTDDHVWLLSHFLADNTRKNEGQIVTVDALKPDLSVDGTDQKTLALNTYYFEELWHHYSEDSFEKSKTYIAVTTANDQHASDYRDHKEHPILAKNARRKGSDYKITFDGDVRSCAGGTYMNTAVTPAVENYRSDASHIAYITANLTVADEDPTKPSKPAANQHCLIKFTTPDPNEGPRLIFKKPDNTFSYEKEKLEAQTDDKGNLSIQVLSSRKPSSAEIQVFVELAAVTEEEIKVADQVAMVDADAAIHTTPPPGDLVGAYTTAYANKFKAQLLRIRTDLTNEQANQISNAAQAEAEKARDAAATVANKQSSFVAAYKAKFVEGLQAIPLWDEVTSATAPTTRRTVAFEKPESKRLFGIKEWGESYDTDLGWEFLPHFVDSPEAVPVVPGDQIVECRVYVRFLKDKSSPVDKGYFSYIQGGATKTTDSMFAISGAAAMTDADFAAFTTRGTPDAPLWNSLDVPDATGKIVNAAHQIYWPVNGHKLSISIQKLDPWNAASTPAISDTVTFWDKVKGLPITSTTLDVTTQDESIDGHTVQGVARFYIRASNPIMLAKEITFAAEDTTTK